jgi:hypothetical protein
MFKKSPNLVVKSITWAKDIQRDFMEEVTQTLTMHKEKCSMSLTFREMQIKTTMRHPYAPWFG